ncbi:hypothetical protein ACLQ3B_32390 [Micromonospora sp. DT53]|uniref:hypothetical protein n=1 Tax=Micromonospora sp. DT53 TaxID=3393444 RepID=UPI003CE91F11
MTAGIVAPSSPAAAGPSWNCSTPVIAKTLESDSSGAWWDVDVSMSCTGSVGARTYSVYAYNRPGGGEFFSDSSLTNDQSYSVSFTIPAAPLGNTDSACVTASSKVEVPELPGDSDSKNTCWPLSWGSAVAPAAVKRPSGTALNAADMAAGERTATAPVATLAVVGKGGTASAAEPPFCQTLGSSWSTPDQGRSGTVTVDGRCEVSKSDYQADLYVNGEFWSRKTGSVSGTGDGEHRITIGVPTMPTPNDSRGNYAWVEVTYTSGASFKISWEEELGYLPCTGC